MNRDRVSSQVEFNYNGEEISGTLFTYYHDDIEKSQTFMFNHRGNNVHIFLEEDQKYWSVAPLHCEIIDKLGIESHKNYEDYLSIIHSIKRDSIIVDDNVYDYFYQTVGYNPMKFHLMVIEMDDGKRLDGSPSNEIFNDEKYNKQKTFNNLKERVRNYHKIHDVIPAKKYLNEEKTEQYQQTKKLIKDIIESL